MTTSVILAFILVITGICGIAIHLRCEYIEMISKLSDMFFKPYHPYHKEIEDLKENIRVIKSDITRFYQNLWINPADKLKFIHVTKLEARIAELQDAVDKLLLEKTKENPTQGVENA